MAYKGDNHKGGRPKGSKGTNTKKAQAMRAVLQEKVAEELEPILEGQIELAKGIVVHRKVKVKGKTYNKYYLSKPDSSAAKYLLDQALGRAKESVEVSGEMTIVDLVNKLEDEDE